MQLEKIKSIQISLLETSGKTDENDQTNYISRTSAKFIVNDLTINVVLNNIEHLIVSMFNDIKEKNKDKVDAVGIWVDYDGIILDNSIKLVVLDDMESFGNKDTNAIYEFFKMCLLEENI